MKKKLLLLSLASLSFLSCQKDLRTAPDAAAIQKVSVQSEPIATVAELKAYLSKQTGVSADHITYQKESDSFQFFGGELINREKINYFYNHPAITKPLNQ